MKKLFVLGDSISIQYGPFLRKMVGDRFQYDRKRGEAEALADLDRPIGANGGDSGMVLNYLGREWDKQVRYDVLLVNCGLHDIKTDPTTGRKQVSPAEYRENLEEIVRIAREMAHSVVWIRTTDADERIHNTRSSSFYRYHDDVVAYNAIADEVMSAQEIPIIDLYTFTRSFGTSAFNDHVHYTEEIQCLQAAYIAGYLDGWFRKN